MKNVSNVRPDLQSATAWYRFVRVVYVLATLALVIACSGKKASCNEAPADSFCKDASFVYTTFSRTVGKRVNENFTKFPAFTRTLRLKIPREYTTRSARKTFIGLDLSFHKIGLAVEPPGESNFDLKVQPTDPLLHVTLMQGVSARTYPVVLKIAARYQLVGDWGGLGHYRAPGCDDVPLNNEYPVVSESEATTYTCQFEYFLSPPLANSRALWIKCTTRCTVSTDLHGFVFHYTFPRIYLRQWEAIDTHLQVLIRDFVVSHQKTNHE
jgi:hypothetical protein